MDSWWRFQHLTVTELWGHGEKRRAGKGNTRTKRIGGNEANPVTDPNADVERKKVAKRRLLTVEKSRYCLQ